MNWLSVVVQRIQAVDILDKKLRSKSMRLVHAAALSKQRTSNLTMNGQSFTLFPLTAITHLRCDTKKDEAAGIRNIE